MGAIPDRLTKSVFRGGCGLPFLVLYLILGVPVDAFRMLGEINDATDNLSSYLSVGWYSVRQSSMPYIKAGSLIVFGSNTRTQLLIGGKMGETDTAAAYIRTTANWGSTYGAWKEL